jgi:hypothetical protein
MRGESPAPLADIWFRHRNHREGSRAYPGSTGTCPERSRRVSPCETRAPKKRLPARHLVGRVTPSPCRHFGTARFSTSSLRVSGFVLANPDIKIVLPGRAGRREEPLFRLMPRRGTACCALTPALSPRLVSAAAFCSVSLKSEISNLKSPVGVSPGLGFQGLYLQTLSPN